MKHTLIILSALLMITSAANAQKLSLARRTIVPGRIFMDVPAGFYRLTDEEAQKEFHNSGGKPVIYANDWGTINVISYIAREEPLEEGVSLKSWLEENLLAKENVSLEWIDNSVTVISGKPSAIFEYIYIDQTENDRVYNLTCYTSLFEDVVLITNFRCDEADLENLQSTAHKIVNSINIKRL